MEELTLNIGGEVVILSAVVIAIVAKLKVWFKSTGWVNTLLAFAVGAALGALIYLAEALGWDIVAGDPTIIQLILKGLLSGFVAAGGYKLIFGKKKE